MQGGKLVFAHDAVVDHPNSDLSKAYPASAYELGYAMAFSRRFLNDHYRISRPPYLRDRVALVKTYLGSSLIYLGKALANPESHRFAFAAGFLGGSIRGLIKSPSAADLAPEINWRQDADEAISQQVEI
jgi:hypothetical protein